MTILVVITASGTERVAEGLRAAVGLGLRGDPVEALLVGGEPPADPRIARALGTLERLGRPARVATLEEARAAARAARAVEVWTDPGSPRRLELAGGTSIDPRSVDSARLVEQIFQADAAVLW
ncbi:MAG TPA: hypothetical protein VFU21_03970 [Kofleriaceae bacterium]|nr:hypothetical protein [Kofleriaceae bacterium]